MGVPLSHGRGHRAHMSPLEYNTPKDQYKLIEILNVNIYIYIRMSRFVQCISFISSFSIFKISFI